MAAVAVNRDRDEGEDIPELAMRYVQPQMIADIINQLDSPFDAHSIEKRLLRLNTVETAREILRYRNSGDVLRTFSAQLARYIDRTFRGQIQKTSKVGSENLGGLRCGNQEWVKLIIPVVAPAPVTNGMEFEVAEDAAEVREDERVQQAIHAVGLRNAAGRMEEDP
jgi:hypothetical protein